jgi:hypothetical protein
MNENETSDGVYERWQLEELQSRGRRKHAVKKCDAPSGVALTVSRASLEFSKRDNAILRPEYESPSMLISWENSRRIPEGFRVARAKKQNTAPTGRTKILSSPSSAIEDKQEIRRGGCAYVLNLLLHVLQLLASQLRGINHGTRHGCSFGYSNSAFESGHCRGSQNPQCKIPEPGARSAMTNSQRLVVSSVGLSDFILRSLEFAPDRPCRS